MSNTKTAEEVLKKYFEYHKTCVTPDANWCTWEKAKEDGTVAMVIDAMHAYTARIERQFRAVDGYRDALEKCLRIQHDESNLNESPLNMFVMVNEIIREALFPSPLSQPEQAGAVSEQEAVELRKEIDRLKKIIGTLWWSTDNPFDRAAVQKFNDYCARNNI